MRHTIDNQLKLEVSMEANHYSLPLQAKATAYYREVLADPGSVDYFEQQQRKNIAKESARREPTEYKHEVTLRLAMSIHSTWQGMKGVVRIADGDAGGWRDIRLAFHYRAWALRTSIASADRAGGPKNFSL